MHIRELVIAIDGPAASGKSTTAKHVADRLGYLHIDTGAMYRAITLKVLKSGIKLKDVDRIAHLVSSTHVELQPTDGSLKTILDGEDVTEQIRRPEVTRAVSAVSSIPQVRQAMVREQRRMGEAGGIVLEGTHDIDCLRWWFGEPVRISGVTKRVGALDIDVEDVAEIVVEFGSGTAASIHLDYLRPIRGRLCELIGDR
ncbi:MAG: (d)CMP kinase, partial [Ignavibacteriae bacterium]|nr:(d)CMP kinase [Ignavibacteriota bacterium]